MGTRLGYNANFCCRYSWTLFKPCRISCAYTLHKYEQSHGYDQIWHALSSIHDLCSAAVISLPFLYSLNPGKLPGCFSYKQFLIYVNHNHSINLNNRKVCTNNWCCLSISWKQRVSSLDQDLVMHATHLFDMCYMFVCFFFTFCSCACAYWLMYYSLWNDDLQFIACIYDCFHVMCWKICHYHSHSLLQI